jgi:aspartyl-tRNA(Asn)/glutamyl-tRNA(Gln) amidotransferase subunit A
MNPEELTNLTVVEAASYIAKKTISPVDLLDAYLKRIERLEPQLNAFILRLDSYAMEKAKTAEREIVAGNYRGPFHGIPIGVKDLFWTEGIATSSGSILEASFVPKEDSAAVANFYRAGSYCIGKLHMSEFAFNGTSRNHHYGPSKNPWDFSKTAGGSSSGSAISVASQEAPIALGTDTGGSVRLPAALCGITGIKPTFGLVSRFGVTPLSWSMDHVGVLSRTVHDGALALNFLAGFDQRDPGSANTKKQDYTRDLDIPPRKLRIGVPKDFIWEVIDQDVKQAFWNSMTHMESVGAEVKEMSIPFLELCNAAGSIVQTSEAAAYHHDNIISQGDKYDPTIRRRIEVGLFISAESYLQAQRVRYKCIKDMISLFEDVDVIATPTVSIGAPNLTDAWVQINGKEVTTREALLRITRVFSTIGFPAISLPCGFTNEGMPVGLQLASRPFSDAMLAQTANFYQQTTSWHTQLPKL